MGSRRAKSAAPPWPGPGARKTTRASMRIMWDRGTSSSAPARSLSTAGRLKGTRRELTTVELQNPVHVRAQNACEKGRGHPGGHSGEQKHRQGQIGNQQPGRRPQNSRHDRQLQRHPEGHLAHIPGPQAEQGAEIHAQKAHEQDEHHAPDREGPQKQGVVGPEQAAGHAREGHGHQKQVRPCGSQDGLRPAHPAMLPVFEEWHSR